MPRFNPDFWEIPVPPEFFDQFTTEDYFWYRAPDDEYMERHRAKRQAVLEQVRQIIAKELTKRQTECVHLYFYKGKTQEEIGDILGISRRVVSQHLFGVTRDGKQVGGAINKIRKVCRKLGIEFP
ncbi:hypothetical protein GBAR_LOCUS28433 [Geodia barretti]|uniref:RNA polymerase sigma-70 region 4 domain-containing protein n=1 Tax=Geodia barretti TaxID=519541 RepID=A0AA35TRY6_GEOBA|nr:hypothetical protein GBAR_LOCUS28433 [Geodia barretti]